MHRDLVLLHQVRDALVELLRDPAAALDHRVQIGADARRGEAVILGVLHIVKDFGRAQQRLGRNAAPVEADAAEIITLDDSGLADGWARADRGAIAAGTPDENDKREG